MKLCTINRFHKASYIICFMPQKFCIDTQLYLKHDLTLAHLCKVLGTNRTYLANYFTSQGITYNTYIKNLRIKHFISLYKQAVASQRVFTIQQLASESGFRNYSTFSTTFKRIMGQNVSEWMCDNA